MNVLLGATTVFIFSLVIVLTLQNIAGKSIRITYLLKKYQPRIILSMTLVLVFVPFTLLLLLGDKVKFSRLTMVFLISLLASITIVFTVEYLGNLLVRINARSDRRNDESLITEINRKPQSDWESSIEDKTLKRFGLNPSVGISFDALDRLGNQFSELALLERDIDELGTESTN